MARGAVDQRRANNDLLNDELQRRGFFLFFALLLQIISEKIVDVLLDVPHFCFLRQSRLCVAVFFTFFFCLLP